MRFEPKRKAANHLGEISRAVPPSEDIDLK